MLARWMATDEDAAMQWALSSTVGGQPSQLIGGAIDWLFEHSEPREAVLALAKHVFRDWAQEEPAEAWQTAAASRLAGEPSSLNEVAEIWFKVNPKAAVNAAVSSDAWQFLRESWVVDLAAKWAVLAPHEATKWALALPPDPQDPGIDEAYRFAGRAKLLAPALAALSVSAPDDAFVIAQSFSEVERESNSLHSYILATGAKTDW